MSSHKVLDRYGRDKARAMMSKDMIHHMMKIRELLTKLEQLKLTVAIRAGREPSYEWMSKHLSKETMVKVDKYLEDKNK